MKVKVAVLSNAGEVLESTRDGLRVLKRTGEVFGHRINIQKLDAMCEDTPIECTKSDAVLIGHRNIADESIESLKKRLRTFATVVPQNSMSAPSSNTCDIARRIERICSGINVSGVEMRGCESIVKTRINEKLIPDGRSSTFVNVGSSGIDIHGSKVDSIRESIISSIMMLRCTLDMKEEAQKLETLLAKAIENGVPDSALADEVIRGLN